ncbi:MAG TPA: PIG-L family deacetylase, partial [Acidimicrobiales bacterium]|nr:PIG-L family deacetylase [Acidimicrobiales bacterium]
MATLVCFHAHPDDEALTTGGVMARAAAAGHRVVLVVATGGEHGEVPEDLAPGETLIERRRAETMQSAATLGVARVAWLGYEDSGMAGWDQNQNRRAFIRADVDE